MIERICRSSGRPVLPILKVSLIFWLWDLPTAKTYSSLVTRIATRTNVLWSCSLFYLRFCFVFLFVDLGARRLHCGTLFFTLRGLGLWENRWKWCKTVKVVVSEVWPFRRSLFAGLCRGCVSMIPPDLSFSGIAQCCRWRGSENQCKKRAKTKTRVLQGISCGSLEEQERKQNIKY